MRCWDWRLSVAVSVATLVWAAPGMARPVADQTLGEERSQVIDRSARDFDVQGGARRGRNLFHSFQEFGVDEGGSVYFLNPDGVENIFSRVTGANRSDILGTLGVRGGANLFLMNPNGILFGQNASLDVQGSFVGTTAGAIGFGNEGFFSATNPQAVPPNLLKVNPSAFLFNQVPVGNLAEITNQAGTGSGLRVGNGRNLLLLGGNVVNDGGNLSAFEGRVDIGAVTGIGTVELNLDGSLSFPVDLARGNVAFTNGSTVNVTLNTAGDIAVTGRNINVTGGSFLKAGIDKKSGARGSQAGDLTLNATDSVVIANGFIRNDVFSGGLGNAGNLTIRARNLTVDSGQISASAFGEGNAGNLTLRVTDSVNLSGEIPGEGGNIAFPGGLFAQVDINTTGRGGNLRIETGHLSISNGSKVQVGTFGQGEAGDLFIRASEIDVFNTGSPRFFTGIFAGILQDPTSRTIPRGNGGNLTIETDRLSIRDGARVSADTSGIGNGGDLSIHATGRVEVVGAVIKIDGITESPSYLGAEVFPSGIITPATPEQITGRGGNLTVRARELSIREGGRVSVSTNAAGDAGNIDIQNAQLVEVIGQSPRSSPSSLRANVGEGARGRGGEINIETVQLNVRNTGQISASTSGSGRAGSIRVQGANSITLDDGSISTAINRGSAAEHPSNINLQTRSLSLNNGSEIIASTQGQGRAGDVTVRDADRVSLNRSTISTEVGTTGAGQGGNIDIRTGSLNLDNHSNVTSSTSGQGDAGTITIRGADISLSNSSLSTAITGNSTGQGGSIRIRNGNSLTLNDRAQVSASNTARGNAGNLDLQLTGNLNANNSRITTSANGENASGGAIAITADNIRLRNNSDLSTEVNRASGNGGDIKLDANSVIAYDDSDIISRAGDRGGDIILNTPAFFGEGYQQNVNNSSPDGNDRVDLNANGRVSSGTIRTPNTDTIQNSLSDLPIGSIDSDRLIANSCIARTREGGTFLVTGSGGLADRPGNTTNSTYPTGEVRAVPINTETWQPGGAIVEPQGVYQLPDGRIVMSRECPQVPQ